MKCAILGCGVVGGGVAEILLHNGEVIQKRSGVKLELKKILDIRDFPECEYTPYLTKSFDEIVDDDEIELVCEAMGGVDPAFDFVYRCLDSGKHVATSNKELIATKGYELLSLAEKRGVNLMFEASVGGGIPIITPIARSLAANRISEVAGILNGTTNFILNKMFDDAMAFADALALAQQKGYAEKNPTADVEGLDACRKICILASLCFGSHVYPNENVLCQGISKISLEDVNAANKAGFALKLIAQAKLIEGRLRILVSPAVVAKASVFGNVHGVDNACLIRGDMIGQAIMVGPGAGKEATASAVVGDMIDMAQHSSIHRYLPWGEERQNYIISQSELKDKFLVRIKGKIEELGEFDIIEAENETIAISPLFNKAELEKALKDFEVISAIRIFE